MFVEHGNYNTLQDSTFLHLLPHQIPCKTIVILNFTTSICQLESIVFQINLPNFNN